MARRLVFSLAILAGFLAAAEGVTRLVWQGPEVDRTMPADPRLRWGLDPGGEMVVDGVANRINSRGYRGPEFQVEKPPCTLRIYSAGDSSAFGHGVPDGEAFVERLPGLLAERGVTDLTVEPINGAVPGYSTYQSLERLDQDGWALAPDLLLISNVWSDAGPAVVPDAEFYEEDPGPGERFPQPPPPPLQRSRFVQWAHGWLRPAQPTHDTQTPTGDFRRVSTAGYARNLGRMFDGARERGVVPVMVVLPFSTDRDDLLAGPPQGGPPWRRDQPFDGQDYRDLARRAAADAGVLLVDLVPVFLDAGGEALFLDDLHPDRRGHALIARTVADAIVGRPGSLDTARARCAAEVTSADGAGSGREGGIPGGDQRVEGRGRVGQDGTQP